NIDLFPIELGSFDVIIGIDWISKQHAEVVCHGKYIRVPYGNNVLIIQGKMSGVRNESILEIISSIRTQRYIEKGCRVFLIQVTKKEEVEIPEKRIEDVPVVRGFLEVFPEDLPGLPPTRQCMSTRSSSSNLVPPFIDPESVIIAHRRNLGDPLRLLDFEEINMSNNLNINSGPPPAGPLLKIIMSHMIQQVQNSCQFHGLPGDDANKHLDKFLTITPSIKQNGVTDDALRLYLFPYSLTHHATAWFDRLPKNSIHTFQEMASKYFPLSMIDTFYNGLTLRHRDTIDAVAGGTFMKRIPEECYDLIENMTAQHNDWDTSAHRAMRLVVVHILIMSAKPPMATLRTYTLLRGLTMRVERPQGALPSNIIPNPREEIKAITTRSGNVLAGPSVPPPPLSSSSKEVEREPETITNQIPPSPVSTSSELPKWNPHQPLIPYPSRLNKEKVQDKSDI
ncbi:hypothetical protein Tco_1416380, partial [Tanacetum coccineum]